MYLVNFAEFLYFLSSILTFTRLRTDKSGTSAAEGKGSHLRGFIGQSFHRTLKSLRISYRLARMWASREFSESSDASTDDIKFHLYIYPHNPSFQEFRFSQPSSEED
jgi:hypothetical protein